MVENIKTVLNKQLSLVYQTWASEFATIIITGNKDFRTARYATILYYFVLKQ